MNETIFKPGQIGFCATCTGSSNISSEMFSSLIDKKDVGRGQRNILKCSLGFILHHARLHIYLID